MIMKKTSKSTLQNLALISQVGLMMVVPILGGVWVGNWLDVKFGTGSLFMIVLMLLGVGAAFRNLIHLNTQKSKEYENKQTPEQYVKAFEKKAKEDREKK